jgi:DNA-binding NtrC family response regulator
VLADGPFLTPLDFPAISGLKASVADMPAIPHTSDPIAGAGLPSAVQLAAEQPADSPVRILDEWGHLRTLEEIERDLIQLAIEIYAGHMTEVAKRLGIGRSTLYRKVREQGLDVGMEEAV